jgi:VanZ family protein
VDAQRRNFLVLTAAVVAVIVYGSLYPFDFHDRAAPGGPVGALLATWRKLSGRGDIIANVLLYLPFGFFAAMALDRLAWPLRVLAAMLLGLALCVAIELTQFYDLGRSSTMSDVYANTTGTLIGAIIAAVVGREFRIPFGAVEPQPFVLLLVIAWLGYRLYPYVPTIDLHKYWNALKPLVFAPQLRPLDLLRHTGTWLALATMLEALFGAARRRIVFLLFVPAVLFLRILILGTVLSPAEVAGGALAVLLWLGSLAQLGFRAGLVAALFTVVITVQGLEPFQFLTRPRPFGWIPFLSFMGGSLEQNTASFFEKVFMYGGLLWLLTRAGLRLALAAPATAGLVLALRYAQTYLPGRSAEITDFVIVVVLAAVMRLVPGERPITELRPARPRTSA